DELGEVGKRLPIFGPQHEQMLQQAQDGMSGAEQHLHRGEARGGQAGEQQAIEKLSQFQDAMEKLAKQSGRGGGGQGGVPMPWGVAGAAKALDELVHAHPGMAEAAYFRGRVLFEQGRYDEAAKAYAEAQERGAGSAPENDARLARAAAEETKGNEVFESAHFVLRTRPGKDTLLAPYALEALEKAYAGLTKDLGIEPPQKVRVEIYDC